MEHLFASYEVARLLKKKGFDEECFGFYSSEKSFHIHYSSVSGKWHNSNYLNFKGMPIGCCAPLYQQVVDWLRKEHNIEVYCLNYYRESNDEHYKRIKLYECRVNDKQLCVESNCSSSVLLYPIYYEALNKAIEEALKLI